jgi:hypothetical protein
MPRQTRNLPKGAPAVRKTLGCSRTDDRRYGVGAGFRFDDHLKRVCLRGVLESLVSVENLAELEAMGD